MSERSRPDRGCSEQTISSLGGKSEVMKQGKSSRISREGLQGVAAKKSESFELENSEQDLG